MNYKIDKIFKAIKETMGILEIVKPISNSKGLQ